MITLNNKIAATPFETNQNRVTVKGGLVGLKAKTELTKLTVLFRDEGNDFEPGDVIFVRGEACKHQYAGEVYEHEETRFILVPRGDVLAVERKPLIPAPALLPVVEG